MRDDKPTTNAVLVKDGQIIALGGKSQLLRSIRSQAIELKNLQGKTLLPAFIDAHGHFLNVGIFAQSANLLPRPDSLVHDFSSMRTMLRSHLNSPQMIETGWVIGMGYDNAQLAELRHPTAQDLDKMIADKPVMVIHQSGHLGVVNTKGLEVLGINANTPNPPGGVIRRIEGTHKPNGILEEAAFFQVVFQLPIGKTQESLMAMVKAGQDAYLAAGFATAQEGRATQANILGLNLAAQKQKLLIDVVSYPDPTFFGSDDAFATMMQQQPTNYQNNYRVGGIKLSLDGSPQAKTAWLVHPYHIPPEGQDDTYHGYPAMETTQVAKYVDFAFANRWQILAHTNGDAASDQLLFVMKPQIQKAQNYDHRTVLIHAQVLRDDQLDRMKRLNMIPSFMSVHTFYWGDWHRDSVLGEARAKRISPAQSALDRGILYTSHNDAPVTLPNAMMILSSQVNRTTRSGAVLGSAQRVSVWNALKAITTNAAYQYGEEDKKGSIAVGKNADFVILDRNPLKVDPSQLSKIKVIETIKSDRRLFRAGTE